MASVAFDCTGRDFGDDEWDDLMRRIDAAFLEPGLPSLYSEAWDDVEDGCVFEGTAAEAAKVREVLSRFPLTVY